MTDLAPAHSEAEVTSLDALRAQKLLREEGVQLPAPYNEVAVQWLAHVFVASCEPDTVEELAAKQTVNETEYAAAAQAMAEACLDIVIEDFRQQEPPVELARSAMIAMGAEIGDIVGGVIDQRVQRSFDG